MKLFPVAVGYWLLAICSLRADTNHTQTFFVASNITYTADSLLVLPGLTITRSNLVTPHYSVPFRNLGLVGIDDDKPASPRSYTLWITEKNKTNQIPVFRTQDTNVLSKITAAINRAYTTVTGDKPPEPH